ncbi:MAG TPA: hypothetical protein DIT07_15260 [Sphingobacteriaceae bacterium]|nr:hypothetical protein [Sphingobacteriaceae bacterium]
MTDAKKSKLIHHAHLYSRENEIELRILFESNTYFGRKLSLWASQINLKMFGSFIQTSNENQNDRLEKIDFTNASLLGVTNSTSQYEGDFEYVIIKIDCIKFYWIPSKENINTAEFYLNEYGFKVVKNFYAPLFGIDGGFNISRMNGMDVFYTLENTEFRPEFNFCYSDNKSNSEAKITKEPKIQFRYKDNITETEAIKYADLIRTIASFYFHTPIDYTLSRIHLEKNTITIKKIQKKSALESSGNFLGFKNYWNFHKLMNSNWQKSALDNNDMLIIVVSRFLHAKNVYDTSKFLIYYSIIEYLKAMHDEINSEFSFIGTKKTRNTKCNEAVNLLLEIVPKEEQEEFKIRLDSLKDGLKFRPMKRPLEELLLKNKINLNECSIDLKKLVEIRNSLVHGSPKIINYDELEKANKLLYRITGILILQLIGVNEWELDLNLE